MTYNSKTGKVTKTKGYKKLIADNGWTVEYMDAEWQRVLEKVEEGKGGVTLTCLLKTHKNWDTLPLHLIKEIPGLADTLQKHYEEKLEEERKAEQELKKADERKQWIQEHLGEYLLDKVDNGEKLSESEIADFYNEFKQIEETTVYRTRWTDIMNTVVQVPDGRFFMIEWQEGLTEYQDNVFDNQPYEVELHEFEKTIVVKEWNAKK